MVVVGVAFFVASVACFPALSVVELEGEDSLGCCSLGSFPLFGCFPFGCSFDCSFGFPLSWGVFAFCFCCCLLLDEEVGGGLDEAGGDEARGEEGGDEGGEEDKEEEEEEEEGLERESPKGALRAFCCFRIAIARRNTSASNSLLAESSEGFERASNPPTTLPPAPGA